GGARSTYRLVRSARRIAPGHASAGQRGRGRPAHLGGLPRRSSRRPCPARSALAVAQQKICVVTSGHLTTCPRIVKAARAFSAAGYDVRVVSATLMDHVREMDKALVARETWEWDPIEWAADREWLTYTRTRVRHNVARRATAVLNHRAPFSIVAAAFHRLHSEVRDRA